MLKIKLSIIYIQILFKKDWHIPKALNNKK